MNVKEAIKEFKHWYEMGYSKSETPSSKALGMAIEALERTRWIPVTERLPKETNTVLIFTKWDDETSKQNYIRQATWANGIWRDVDANTEENITHWMPLPEPPEVE